MVFFAFTVNAQLSTYGFEETAGTFTSIVPTATYSETAGDDTNWDISTAGTYSFTYNGTVYSDFSMQSN